MEVTGEFLWGVEAISEAIGLEVRSTYHMLSSGYLPAKKVGGKWVASRARLLAFLVSDETLPPRAAKRPPVDHPALDSYVVNSLLNSNIPIDPVAVSAYSPDDLLQLPNFAMKALKQVREWLYDNGRLRLAGDSWPNSIDEDKRRLRRALASKGTRGSR